MATGENSGAWGTVTNNNLSAIEEAIARTTDVSFAADAPTAAVTLTSSNALQAGRNYRLNLIGTGTAGHVLLLPTVEKSYLINNTLSVDVSVRNGTAAGTNLFNTQTVPAGGAAIVYTDGSAVTSAVSSASAMDIATTLDVGAAASVGGTLGVTGNASITGTLAIADEFTFATANSTGNLGVVKNASVGGTLLTTGGVLDADGNLRAVPKSRNLATQLGTAAGTDTGNFIMLTGTASSTQTLVLTKDVFSAGDIFTVLNTNYGGKTAAAVTTFSAAQLNTCFVAGAETSTALVTLAYNGVASVLFIDSSACVITGNVS